LSRVADEMCFDSLGGVLIQSVRGGGMVGRTTTTTSLLMVGNRGIIGEPWAAIRWIQGRVM
jgi:hypothetical protein